MSNEEVLNRVTEKRCLIKVILQKEQNWIGHILRGNSLLKEVMEERILGRTQKGRQWKTEVKRQMRLNHRTSQ